MSGSPPVRQRHPARVAVTLAALGVVFGDIGTSPIYTIQTIFNPEDPHPVPLTVENIYGSVSLIFWSVTLIVTALYVGLVLRADNEGEGGIMSLITRITRSNSRPAGRSGLRTVAVLSALGILGASLFLADSMITPAISVLSAVEGLRVVEPALGELVIPITLVIILFLFLAQRAGTARVGRLFGPVMVLWFLTIGAAGVTGIIAHPDILRALSPTYALAFLVDRFEIAFFALAAVVLAFTGAEALYADLGHFGRAAITRGWLLLVFPACTLSYFGQGALLLSDPTPDGPVRAPFFLLMPSWALIPLVLLATAATVIASQAVISGAFSVARQAIQLGYLPRFRVVHTSAATIGQIYVPWVNWALMVMVILLVVAFETSAALAFAFGMAVIGSTIVTTVLLSYVARRQWGWPLWLVVPGAAVAVGIESLYFAANLTKLLSGAWVPLLIGLVIFTVMTTWHRGRQILTERRERLEGSLDDFIANLQEHRRRLARVPGTAIFLTRSSRTVPLALRDNVKHNHVRHDRVVIVSIQTASVPLVADDEIAEIHHLGPRDDGITQVVLRFGYMQRTDVGTALANLPAADLGAPLELADASYFLSTVELELDPHPAMPRWRTVLFIATSFLADDAARAFELPRDRTLVVGSRISL